MMTAKRLIVLGTHNRKKGLELAGLFAPFGVRHPDLGRFRRSVNGRRRRPDLRRKCAFESLSAGGALAGLGLGRRQRAGRRCVGRTPGSLLRAILRAAGHRCLEQRPAAGGDAARSDRTARGPLRVPRHLGRSHRDTCGPTPKRLATGAIACAPRGTAGFGYDPLFEVVEYHRTFGGTGGSVKSLLSHRGRAVRSLLSEIVRLVRTGGWADESSVRQT